MAKRASKSSEYYVDKKAFYDDIVAYFNMPEPKNIPDSIGSAFMKIAAKFGSRGNFRNYTFNDEMIDDAVENMIYALKFFNPQKSNNPFGYFTKVALFAFLRRIQIEAKQQYIRHKNFQRVYQEIGQVGDAPSERSMEVIDNYERKIAEAKERKRTGEKSPFRLF
jgi:hypothetical protein